MLKHSLSALIGICSAIVLASPITSLAASYDVMGFDGKVTSVEDETIDKIVENIKNTDGQEAADAYVEAMATGSYNDFYEIVKDDTETNRRSEYMMLDGKDVSGNPANDPQEIEMWIQTIIGPESTAADTGKAAREAGFDDTIDGLNKYFMAILMEQADRPSYAKNPAYRISELRLVPRTIEEAELYANENIIVEYEDAPLSEFQHQIIDRYGFTIMPASEMEVSEDSKDTDQPDETAVSSTDSSNETVEEKGPVTKTAFNFTSTQFILITIIAVTLAVLITVIIARKK